MAPNPMFLRFVRECLADLGPVTTRGMFGGAGVYADGVMFGLVASDVLYFKVDAETALAYEAEGARPFTYDGKSKSVQMSYWQVPDRLFDDGQEMIAWAQQALNVARRAKRPASQRKPKRPRKSKPY